MQAHKTAKILSAVMAVSLGGSMVHAAPTAISWSNTGTTDFETGSNWTGGVAPANDLTTNIAAFATAAGMTQPSLTADRSVAGLVITNNGVTSLALSGNYTLNVGASGVTQNVSGASSTISANVNVSAAQSWNIRNTLNLSGVLSGSSALTTTGPNYLSLNGAAANTYGGLLTLSGTGRVYLNKSAGVDALAGDVAVNNASAQLTWFADDQVADSSNITLSAGAVNFYKAATGNIGIGAETFHNLNVSGGTVYTDGAANLTGTVNGLITNQATSVTGGTLRVSGGTQWTTNSLAISGGGFVNRIGTSYTGSQRALTVGSGGLSITNQATGAYAPITIGSSLAGKAVNKLVLQGDVTFTGMAGNASTTSIASDVANPVRGTVQLNGVRTFTINDGEAAVDLKIDPAVNDNGATAGGLTKAGLGTLELAGVNGYTGATTVTAGQLIVSGSIANSAVTVTGGALGGNGSTGALTITSNGVLAPGGSIGLMTVASLDVSGVNVGGLQFELGQGGLSDRVNASGALALGTLDFGDFNFASVGALADGSTYTLLHGGSLNGSLGSASGSLGGGFTGTLSLSGNDVLLSVAVPEPGTVGLFVGVVSLGLLRRQRRTRA